MDALTSGLKRITLKLPPKEEYEAREREKEEKQKALEASKKTTTKPAARKPAAPRTTSTKSAAKPAATTTRRGPGRPPKSSKPASPVQPEVLTPPPDAPYLQSAATAILIQPQPVQPDAVSALVQLPPSHSSQVGSVVADPAAVDRRTSAGLAEPPNEDTPIEELREQLPEISFITVKEPLRDVTPPTRSETPPPPPPTNMSDFVNYTANTFSGAPVVSGDVNSMGPSASAPLQWLPPNTEMGAGSLMGPGPMSPPSKRQDLPIFTANGLIPFAPSPNPPTTAGYGHQGVPAAVKKEDNQQDIWDVPDTPAR
jgi:histone deacetylase HOS3